MNDYDYEKRVPRQNVYQASPRQGSEGRAERPAGRKVSASSAGTKSSGILYDARGVRVKKSKLSGSFMKTLLFFVLPYIVINAIVFIIVTASPKITVNIKDTTDYVSSTAEFEVKCLLPVKELMATIDSEPVEYEKSGKVYTAQVAKNGTFYVEATCLNGMRGVGYADVSLLDDMPPVINEQSCHIEEGILTFTVSDTQSGVDWDSIKAVTGDGREIRPSSIDRDTGKVAIEMLLDKMEISIADLVGNERSASITATSEQMSIQGPVTEEAAEASGEEQAESAEAGA